ncbi:hypothetical protein Q4534_16055 [Cyclobacterium sp. 1_MG-2023]|uniref:hypothetical protein n=1 Tax=Cyclobacterium sp. 1_MG-2023 TaxID=3062681 RepID=UPI0026E3E7C9|nr:hypothetical protein [Cyclobacterium sp. 1_MG-2023]MDO6438936.1 hypothetical protein [Cyclobacterium sp. 1_MG-2023]
MKKHKAIRFIMVSTFLFLQISFLAFMVKEKYESETFFAVALLLIISITMLLGYRYLDLHHEEYAYENISVVLWVPVGAVICYLLNITAGLGSVLSAGITGTLASFLPLFNKKSEYLSKVPTAIYCGAFIGMSSLKITPSIGYVMAAGMIGSGTMLLSKNLFLGIGGKLGTVAFVGVVIVYLIYWVIK